MSHSTFRQPLPDDLAPLMAKGYTYSKLPPLAYFETIVAPAGGLSATGTDMGRFIRALMNGGELDGVRILPKARLDEMMTPSDPTPAGYLGLTFFGTKVAGRDAIGHEGETMAFSSGLQFFLKQGVGIFVSLDGTGEIKATKDNYEPDPVAAIAERFLPKAPGEADADSSTANSPSDSGVAGIYHSSRRAESAFTRFNDLVFQAVFKIDGAGNAKSFAAFWPFGDGAAFKRVERKLYEGPGSARIAFIDGAGSESYVAHPGGSLQRVPWSLDARWIWPALVVSAAVALLTLLAWPVAALWRRWRKRRWSQDSGDRRKHQAMRLVMLVDAVVIVATVVLVMMHFIDLTIYNDALDPMILVLYALAWLGVFGAIPTLWAATRFWRNGVGSRWSRVHHSLIAASSVMMAWFFLTFHIAGTTLTY
jgi:Beta-lactamase